MVLLRDRATDTMDLTTKLSIYGVEAGKLRGRLVQAHAEASLARWVTSHHEMAEAARETQTLPFSSQELARLQEIFGPAYLDRLYEIAAQAGEVSVYFQRGDHHYSQTALEHWLSGVRKGLTDVLNSTELDDDLRVHIVSSNTRSVNNCLSPWLHQHAQAILDQAQTAAHLLAAMDLQADQLYYAVRSWFTAHPEETSGRLEADRAGGIYQLTDNSHTGIQVSLIDANCVRAPLDPLLAPPSFSHRTLIVNIDYAYGQQAELILRSLILLFGQRIRSISVFGKSGAVIGKRGDLLLPTQMLLQTDDQLYPIPNHDLRPADLRAVGCNRPLHRGTLLTVLGTVMQSREMLYFYRYFYDLIGMEMEGSFYLREIQRSLSLDLLRPEVQLRFAYYTSDTPLEPNQSLASNLSPAEGVPAVYAITRAVLRRILAEDE